MNIAASTKLNNFLHKKLNVNDVEEWSRSPKITKQFYNKDIKIRLGLTCVGFIQKKNQSVSHALFKKSKYKKNDKLIKISAKIFIVAAGGIASNQLILNSIKKKDGLKLLSKNLIGKFYMCHLSESIADIKLLANMGNFFFGFTRLNGGYSRRLIKFPMNYLKKKNLLNISFYIKNLDISNYRHKNGLLSIIYLILSLPFVNKLFAPKSIIKKVKGRNEKKYSQHLVNIFKDPFSIIRTLFFLFYSKVFKRDDYVSRFLFQPSKDYNGLQFISEQEPKASCKLILSKSRNYLGQQKIDVDFKWSKNDIKSIIKAHYLLDKILRKNNLGKLIFHHPRNKLFKFLNNNCIDGIHQLGGLRMGTNFNNGVTNNFGQLFGAKNVFISSTALFPTGGSSAPTFTLVALVFRQVNYIIKYFKFF